MKHFFFCLLAISPLSLAAQKTINPVVGDTSYLIAFGTLPDETADEQLRIRTHLLYVEQLLRSEKCDHLAREDRNARAAILDHLHVYALRGRFPQNTVYAGQRRPCFIDDAGTICAVGYLVELTAGREIAEAINRDHQYDYVNDMQLPQLESWAKSNGLTIRECAMIQPTYDYIRYVMRTSRCGLYGGYTAAFSRQDALKAGPGFEIAGYYKRHLYKRWSMQASMGYVMRNQTLRAPENLRLRNERWSTALLVHYAPEFKWKWAQRLSFKTGVQLDFFDISSPLSTFNAERNFRNEVLTKKSPEALAVGEICVRLKPNKWISHTLSVVYLRGLRTTFSGQVTSEDGSVLTYDNSGSYLSVRYAFQMNKLHPHD